MIQLTSLFKSLRSRTISTATPTTDYRKTPSGRSTGGKSRGTSTGTPASTFHSGVTPKKLYGETQDVDGTIAGDFASLTLDCYDEASYEGSADLSHLQGGYDRRVPHVVTFHCHLDKNDNTIVVENPHDDRFKCYGFGPFPQDLDNPDKTILGASVYTRVDMKDQKKVEAYHIGSKGTEDVIIPEHVDQDRSFLIKMPGLSSADLNFLQQGHDKTIHNKKEDKDEGWKDWVVYEAAKKVNNDCFYLRSDEKLQQGHEWYLITFRNIPNPLLKVQETYAKNGGKLTQRRVAGTDQVHEKVPLDLPLNWIYYTVILDVDAVGVKSSETPTNLASIKDF